MQSLDQLLLPFAEREYVDVRRTCRILGVSPRCVLDLRERGIIEMIDYRFHARKRVRYQSIVDLCDRLRQRYAIPDTRPPLASPMLRHRDVDLLPFPLTDTIDVLRALEVLGYVSKNPIYRMIEEGQFWSYRISDLNPWRISKRSLGEFLLRARQPERTHRAG